ncbi:hypothetical protein ACIRSU_34210 [Streptomyces sp. NPDC101160]|uniref:hypothetical protein n=1 Tax=Streptomyces sp. NPDC101160 TaxID=3366118 RepID=UPI0037F6E35B
MRSPLSGRLRPALILGLALVSLTACSSGDGAGPGGHDTAAEGRSATEVCGGFAKSGPTLAALTALVGGDGLSDDRSEPEATLKALQEADGKLSPQEMASGSPFCRLRKAGDSESALDIVFREALVIPHSRDDQTFRSFATGAEAESSNRYAKILFNCRTPGPARDLIVAAELERLNETSAGSQDTAVHQITVLNAAARAMAAKLGCQNTELVDGVPAAVKR